MSRKAAPSILGLIGETPMVELSKILTPSMAAIWAKLEAFNPGGSVKDRIALAMIDDAEERGVLKPGGTITGVGEVLKRKNPKIRVIAVEPAYSAVLSGKPAGHHRIQGIGAGFVPEVLDRSVVDEVMQVDDMEAYQMARALAKMEGVLVGISAGANVLASLRVAEKLGAGKTVVTILCDTGERYLSLDPYFEEF